MTEQELRESVRRQIIQNFHENKDNFTQKEHDKVSLKELRSLVRSELIKRLNEKNEKIDSEVQDAVDKLAAMNSQIASIASSEMSKDAGDSEKKTESLVGLTAGLVIGLPGLLHVMSKAASLVAKGFNKLGGNFDEKKEGETFHHWSKKTKEFYIDKILKPIVKRVFKAQIKGNEKKAQMYAEVVYAVLLAGIALTAGIEIVSHGVEGFSSFSSTVKTAYEAAHGAETGLTSAGMLNGLRAAFSAVGEAGAVAAIQGASKAV